MTITPADIDKGWTDLRLVRTRADYARQVRRETAVTVATWAALAVTAPLAAYLLAHDAVRAIAAVMVAAVGGV